MSRLLNRRAALGRFAGLPALAILPAVAMAAADPADDHALTLWERRHALREPFLEAYRAYNEAEARMPWWAVAGESFLESDGSLKGPFCGWPAIQGVKPSEHQGSFKLIRPGLSNLREIFDFNALMRGREAALPPYRRQLRALAERRKAQKAEERLSGFTAASAAIDELHRRLEAVNDEIEALSPATPNAGAALIILSALTYLGPKNPVYDSGELEVAAAALRHMRPALRGIIAAHVDDLLDNPDRRLGTCLIYVGDYQHGKVPLQAYPGVNKPAGELAAI